MKSSKSLIFGKNFREVRGLFNGSLIETSSKSMTKNTQPNFQKSERTIAGNVLTWTLTILAVVGAIIRYKTFLRKSLRLYKSLAGYCTFNIFHIGTQYLMKKDPIYRPQPFQYLYLYICASVRDTWSRGEQRPWEGRQEKETESITFGRRRTSCFRYWRDDIGRRERNRTNKVKKQIWTTYRFIRIHEFGEEWFISKWKEWDEWTLLRP